MTETERAALRALAERWSDALTKLAAIRDPFGRNPEKPNAERAAYTAREAVKDALTPAALLSLLDDAERLDFLERHQWAVKPDGMDGWQARGPRVDLGMRMGHILHGAHRLREAIDAARTEERTRAE